MEIKSNSNTEPLKTEIVNEQQDTEEDLPNIQKKYSNTISNEIDMKKDTELNLNAGQIQYELLVVKYCKTSKYHS